MSRFSNKETFELLRSAAIEWNRPACTEPFLHWVGDADVVLIGEASHGTEDFYAERAWLTRVLIEEKGFNGVAIEGDWPHAYRVNEYVHGSRAAVSASEALQGFARFPQWMWRNTVVARFVAWLAKWNARQPDRRDGVGFYGLDLYSLHDSMRAVVDYLEKSHPDLARSARHSYGCFEDYGEDPESYAWATARLGEGSCEDAVVEQLLRLRQREREVEREHGRAEMDEFFSAEQNARLAKNAERYYRTMVRGRVESWNQRDRHMAETLREIMVHHQQTRGSAKVVVWAHNSHLGDARATELGRAGELNLGQLVREEFGSRSRNLGLTTYSGTVTAASDWGEEAQQLNVRPALEESYEELLHRVGLPRFFLPLDKESPVRDLLADERLERAIGVIYRPETERYSHYFHASLSAQFDGVLHLDETRALQPLESHADHPTDEFPETYPTGV